MKTETDWGQLGREAVRLGMPWEYAMPQIKTLRTVDGWSYAPDFSDTLTELACIPWVQEVAREVYGERNAYLRVAIHHNGAAGLEVWTYSQDARRVDVQAESLAEAAIAAARSMRGEG